MKIILVRHGDPDYEKDCLTELGHKQAKVVAQRLLKENIDEIYSSPLGRAKQTAEILFPKALGYKVPDIKKVVVKVNKNNTLEDQIKEALKFMLK